MQPLSDVEQNMVIQRLDMLANHLAGDIRTADSETQPELIRLLKLVAKDEGLMERLVMLAVDRSQSKRPTRRGRSR